MLTEYIRAAMRRAHYELMESGRFFGSIEPCRGCWGEGPTLEECREELRGAFQKIVKRAFSQRRKMMLKLLKEDWPEEKLALHATEVFLKPLERLAIYEADPVPLLPINHQPSVAKLLRRTGRLRLDCGKSFLPRKLTDKRPH